MAPPFETEDEDSYSRRGQRDRVGTFAAPTGILATNPELINQILDGKEEMKGTREKEKEETETKPCLNRYEQPRKINRVTLEIPLILESPPQESGDLAFLPQLKLSKNCRCGIHCHAPPSNPNGRWTGSITGNSNIHRKVGSTNAAMDLSCRVSPSVRLMGGLELSTNATTRPLRAHVGAQYMESKQDMIQVVARQHGNNSLGLHLTAKEVMDPWILTHNSWFNTSSRDWGTMFSFTSMTTHILRLGLGLTSAAKTLVGFPLATIHIALDPKLHSNRRAPASLQYQPANETWQGSVSFQTCKPLDSTKTKSSIPSSWRIGIQKQGGSKTHQSSWSMIFSWQQGDFTLSIPILLGSMTGMSAARNHSLMAVATPYILIVICGMANEMLSQALWGRSLSATTLNTTSSSSAIKAKEDAAAQQRLMKRTAEAKKAMEEEKGGLVVESAIYQFGDVSWDVTIPLLFWVNNNSSIVLAAGSKQNLLGFYPLTDEDSRDGSAKTDHTDKLERQQSLIPWWQEYWTPTNRRKQKVESAKIAKPTLKVDYLFKGEVYKVTIGDEEELVLP